MKRKDEKAFKAIKIKIKESCLQDFKTWVSETVTKITEKTNDVGDVKNFQPGQHAQRQSQNPNMKSHGG